jgi:putative membrane protein
VTGDQPPGERRPRPRPGAAREYLANERTLLAWTRTGVTLVALGFAVARFGVFLEEQAHTAPHFGPTAALGIALGATGAVMMALSVVRFFRARAQISAGCFKPEVWPEALLAAITAALGIGVATYLALNG